MRRLDKHRRGRRQRELDDDWVSGAGAGKRLRPVVSPRASIPANLLDTGRLEE
jgi:hypothetical protein